MLNKKVFAFFPAACLSLVLSAQLSSDALRFTQTRSMGSARLMGVGGAMGSIGADFAAISLNPAGTGVYRKSDFSFSFLGHSAQIESSVKGDNNNLSHQQNRLSGAFSGIGLVICTKPIGSNWKQFNVALGINGMGSFEQDHYFSGMSAGSILHRYYELSLDPSYSDGRGFAPDDLDDFEAGLAYETGALYELDPDLQPTYYTTDLLEKKNVQSLKSETLRQKGFARNFVMGVGANYNEFVQLGANLEVPVGSYSHTKRYQETNPGILSLQPFDQIKTEENLNTDYGGVQLKTGVIFKPVHALRIGLAWHSPSYLWMEDNYNTSMQYRYFENNTFKTENANSPDGYFKYRLITPMRWVGSVSLVGKFGFLSFDIDRYDPSSARFDLTAESDFEGDRRYQEELNNDIVKQFKPVTEFRFGGELVLDQFRIRAGYLMMSSPYENNNEFQNGLSAGLGIRLKIFYLDLGLNQFKSKNGYLPFLTGQSDFDSDGTIDAVTTLVQQNKTMFGFQCTMGFKF
ncbi:MAG: hypothetical protein IPM48_08440 [Saprospiraceae bacterium]|nr:hypothetical protein [Saprospiraceae bacterium]